MWYSMRLPGARSCLVKVAGYFGGPHQRSSWRGSAHSCQMRSTDASNSASIVRVSLLGSLRTAVTVIVCAPLFPRFRWCPRLGDEFVHAVDPSPPQPLVLVEQPARDEQPLGVGADDPATADALLCD